METEKDAYPASDRLPSGIAGLDTVLQGGFLRGNVYLILGPPGAGKTTLANQLCFNHVANGGRAVYLTLLVESDVHLLSHLRPFAFYTDAPIGDTLFYYSSSADLAQDGLDGLLKLVRTTLRDQRPKVLVLDSLSALGVLGDEGGLKRFIKQLQTWSEAYQCTTFLTKVGDTSHFETEHTMVDGIVALSDQRIGLRTVRQLEVTKFRGSTYLRGSHLFEITELGVVVYPRTEAVLPVRHVAPASRQRLDFGVTALDEMLGGGLLPGSSTALLGVPGSGKTLLGLTFLINGARKSEPGLFLGFYEPPDELLASAESIGLPLRQCVMDGTIDLLWQPAFAHLFDELTLKVLDRVQRQSVRRLFIDGLDGLRATALSDDRFADAHAALTHRLRSVGVTTLASVNVPNLFGPAVQEPLDGLTTNSDNIVFLRQVELRSQLYRLISIYKMRGSPHSRAIREFTINDIGIDVAATFDRAEGVLTGIARPLPAAGSL